MSNVGKEIQDFYCNGFAGRRYDLSGSTIEMEGADYIMLRTLSGEPVPITFSKDTISEKQNYIDSWTSETDED